MKILYVCTSDISTLNSSSLKLVDKFTYLGSSVSSTKTDINIWLAKVWRVIDRLPVIWKSHLTNKIKCSFFRAAVMLILLYGCTTWTQTKWLEKKQKLYGHLPPIIKTIKVRRTRHAGHCWKTRDKLIRDILQWTPSHGWAKAGRPARTYIQQLCTDTGCNSEDLPEAMDNRERWRERIRDIHADFVMWWWYKLWTVAILHSLCRTALWICSF